MFKAGDSDVHDLFVRAARRGCCYANSMVQDLRRSAKSTCQFGSVEGSSAEGGDVDSVTCSLGKVAAEGNSIDLKVLLKQLLAEDEIAITTLSNLVSNNNKPILLSLTKEHIDVLSKKGENGNESALAILGITAMNGDNNATQALKKLVQDGCHAATNWMIIAQQPTMRSICASPFQ